MGQAVSSLKYVAVLAGSAGALPVILKQVGRLFARGSSCLFVIYHRPPDSDFDLASYVPMDAGFTAGWGSEGEPVQPNRLYYPRDAHDLEVRDGTLHVGEPRELYRPNIDRLLFSVAREYGEKVVAVLLSGAGSDGIEGMMAVRRAGGVTIAEDPKTARAPMLPAASVQSGSIDYVLTADRIVDLVEGVLAGTRRPQP
jgi:chemotaxis response regulator CheB